MKRWFRMWLVLCAVWALLCLVPAWAVAALASASDSVVLFAWLFLDGAVALAVVVTLATLLDAVARDYRTAAARRSASATRDPGAC